MVKNGYSIMSALEQTILIYATVPMNQKHCKLYKKYLFRYFYTILICATSIKQLINSLDEKLALCEKYKVDNVVVVPFSIEFSRQSPQEYIEQFLIKSFKPRYIVIGYDHKFGLNRAGNISFLKEYEAKAGFEVIEIKKQELEDIAISSSMVRRSLDEGNVAAAAQLLGNNYKLVGTIMHGDKIGQTIGFPTANVRLDDKDKLIPKNGVYAVKCIVGGLPKEGMMYIGRRPTLSNDQQKTSIEVNIFDFNDDVYEESIDIELITFIREDIKFDSLNELKAQLHKDQRDSITALNKLKNLMTSQHRKVCIAILNYNGVEYLEAYLPKVLYSSSSPINIAVIDNGSTDDSVEYIKEWHPEIQLIELTQNYGFAEGYNQGIKQIDAEYIVLLNSDVLVTDHWLDPIIHLMDEDHTIGACQPKVLSLEKKTHFEYAGASGGFVDSHGYPYCRGRIMDTLEADDGQYNTITEIDWATGAAMVVRANLYTNLLGLDKDYFAHMEEIDFCYRIKKAGYHIKAVPASVVYHLGGGTLDYGNPKKVFLNFRNNLWTIIKNSSTAKLLWLFPLKLILDGLAGVKFLLEGQPKSTMAIVKAHFSTYGRFGHTLRKKAIYNREIRKHSIGQPIKRAGKVKSILVNYFLLGKKKYSDL